jgi:hypothetical protein
MEKETPNIDSKEQNDTDRFYELIKACNNDKKPDPNARNELQRLLKNSEVARSVMEEQEGLYTIAQRSRIENFQASDAFKEVAKAKCRQLREALGYANANKLEKLAIEQIVLCWLNYYQIEIVHSGKLSQSHNTETGLYWEKRLDIASRRYNRALDTLSKMRKLNLILQVNQAKNQIIKNG